MEEGVDLIKCLEEKIQSGWHMVERLKAVAKVDGVDKLMRKIQQEIKFLEKVRSVGNVKKEHLQSTNLIHLNAIVERLLIAKDPINVLKPFKWQDTRMEVDIVCDGGSSWVKVIARNAKALTLISRGNGEYGQKSVIDQAKSYLRCAKDHPHMYRPPDIVFHFAYGIEKPLADKLVSLRGVIVEGDKFDIEDTENSTTSKVDSDTESEIDSDVGSNEIDNEPHNLSELNNSAESTDIKALNLDVSTLLAYVTNMTNGHANFVYKEPLLTIQAEWERCRPVKPVLDKLFIDKELVVCQTAYDNFTDIINLIGGPLEKVRAEKLLSRVRIVDNIPEGKIMELSLGGKIKDRSRLIFATGCNLKSITVSANEGFVRAARMQGFECMVFIHEPRSLSEIKESNAIAIEPS